MSWQRVDASGAAIDEDDIIDDGGDTPGGGDTPTPTPDPGTGGGGDPDNGGVEEG
ncbi:MAG: hypothetical protein IJ897_00440 [Prevotella sp.]|nr:hypothetical protein [Prevotella sp.]